MQQEHVVIQCPLSPDCFVRVSVWGKASREAIELLMQLLTLQMEGGVYPSEETLQQRKLTLLSTEQQEQAQ